MGSAAILMLASLALLIVLVIGYAWIDGGRRPLRPMVEGVHPRIGAARHEPGTRGGEPRRA